MTTGDQIPAASGGASRRFIERHQRGILVGWTVLLMCLLAGAAEVRIHTLANRGDYYIGRTVSKRLIRYPFGDMPFNSDGYPDRDWDPADLRERVGFWGDSITSGVGAGFGYRYTDLIGAARHDRYYMDFGGPGRTASATIAQ